MFSNFNKHQFGIVMFVRHTEHIYIYICLDKRQLKVQSLQKFFRGDGAKLYVNLGMHISPPNRGTCISSPLRLPSFVPNRACFACLCRSLGAWALIRSGYFCLVRFLEGSKGDEDVAIVCQY